MKPNANKEKSSKQAVFSLSMREPILLSTDCQTQAAPTEGKNLIKRSCSPNLPIPWGMASANLAGQHRSGHQTAGNGGGNPGPTTQIRPPNCGERWMKPWPNNTDLATKLWGTVEETLAQQHRSGHQTVGNGGGNPGPTTQIWPPNCGEQWMTFAGLYCPVCVITRPEELMHGLSNAEEGEDGEN